MSKPFKTSIILALLLAVCIVVPIRHSKAAYEGFWLTGFLWRKSHVINGSSYGALTDYCVRIDVHRETGTDNGRHVYVGNYCKSDFGDIRFASETRELDYFLYNQTADLAQFWVEMDSIPASPSNATIYVYYGNATATTTSNDGRTSLYDHGDDFNDQAQNETLWDIFAIAGGSIIETAEGLLRCVNDRGYLSDNDFDIENTEISIFYNNTILAEGGLAISQLHDDNEHPIAKFGSESYYVVLNNQSDRFEVERRTGATKTTQFLKTWDRPDNYLRMRFNGSHAIFVEGDTVQYAESYGIDSGDYTKYFYFIALRASHYENGPDYFDNFFIRKYVEPEPSHLADWGYQESNDPWPLDDWDYRKRVTLVSYDGELSDHPVEVITHSGDEQLATHGVIGKDTKGTLAVYPTISRVYTSHFTPNASGYIGDISCYIEQVATDYPQVTVAIYSRMCNESRGIGGNQPCRLLGYASNAWIVTAGFDDWRTWSLNQSVAVGPDMEYYLMVWVENRTKNSEGCYLYTLPAAPGFGLIYQNMEYGQFPNWPDPWPYANPCAEGFYLSIYSNLTSETRDDTREVYLNNHAQNDFDDVRFMCTLPSELVTPCSYFLESVYLGDNATFWVETPFVANESITYCWVYYGNAAAGNISDNTVGATFFDDFDGSAEPPEGWNETIVGTPYNDVTEYSYYREYNFTTAIAWSGGIINHSITTADTWTLEARVNVTMSGNPPLLQIRLEGYNGSSEIVYMAFVDSWTGNDGRMQSKITGTTQSTSIIYNQDTYLLEIVQNGTHYLTYYTVGGGSRTLLQTKAETTGIDYVRIHFRGGNKQTTDNPSGLVHYVRFTPDVAVPTYAWAPERWHGFNVTYYFTTGGVFLANWTGVLNGSTHTYFWQTTITLGALGNTSMLFYNFTFTGGVILTTGVNPYMHNFSTEVPVTIWCRFRTPPAVIRYDLFFGGLMLIACIAGLLGYSVRRRTF